MKEYNMDFNKLVYGHTHVPCFEKNYKFQDSDDEKATNSITVYNTGGWVKIDNINTIDKDTAKTPNPMFLFKDGGLQKVLMY